MTTPRPIKFIVATIVTWILVLWPLLYLSGLLTTGHLGPDPAKTLALFTGEWSLRLFVITLLLSSLARHWPGLGWTVRYRRLLGLSAFAYASLHLLVFVSLYLGFDIQSLGEELNERPFVLVGFTAWLCLLPMALTSTRQAVKKMGAQAWKRLHRLAYPGLVLALVHLAWQVRASWYEAAFFGAIGALLLIERGASHGGSFSVRNHRKT